MTPEETKVRRLIIRLPVQPSHGERALTGEAQLPDGIPTLFISYSHDSQEHKDWVLQLAQRLVSNGVDVILDQWNTRLGDNLQEFMEGATTDSERVLAVCTSKYVGKANGHQGGVGYEKTILTAELMKDQSSRRIIPLIRDNDLEDVLPRFLAGRKYIDFRDGDRYEAKYAELIHELHGLSVRPRPPLGPNPFSIVVPDITPILSQQAARYVSPGLQGIVSFDYTNNNGSYVIGSGDYAFETKWSTAGPGSIYAYTDAPSIRSIALAVDISDVKNIVNATRYDASSRVRTARVGDAVVWQNVSGYYAVTTIDCVTTRDSPGGKYELVFSFAIQINKSADFSNLPSQTIEQS